MQDNRDFDEKTRYLRLAGAPFVLIVAPICGFFIGSWLDGYFQTSPYLSFFFLFLGIVSGVREFYQLFKNVGYDDKPKS